MPPRKPVVTPENVIPALLEARGMVYIAARRMGVDPSGVYRLIRNNKQIAAAWEAIKGETLDTVELKLWQKIMADDLQAITFFLRTKGRERGYTERTEVTGADGGALRVVVEYADTDNHAA